jgi:hypothetical protein
MRSPPRRTRVAAVFGYGPPHRHAPLSARVVRAVLAVPPDPGDPLTAQVHAQRAAVEALRAVASRKRPLVVFLDDLQWAGRTPLGVVDLVLTEEPIEGLLLVGAYRDGDIDAAHPVAAHLSQWRDPADVRHLLLGNLNQQFSEYFGQETLEILRSWREPLQGDGGEPRRATSAPTGPSAAHANVSVVSIEPRTRSLT